MFSVKLFLLDELLLNLVFEDYSKVGPGNSVSLKPDKNRGHFT